MRLALTEALIIPASNGVIKKGTLLISNGVIEAVGDNVKIPRDADAANGKKGPRGFASRSADPGNKEANPLRAHAHRADDIITAIRIAAEFNVDLVIEHGTDGYKVAPELALAKVPVVHGPLAKSARQFRTVWKESRCSQDFDRAQGAYSFLDRSSGYSIQNLRMQTMTAVEQGVNPEAALKAITIYPAQIMGIHNRVGSLEKGKDADVVVLSGLPFEAGTRVNATMVNGKLCWQRENEKIAASNH